MTLTEAISKFWTTFIHKPHQHDWQFDRTFRDYVSSMELNAESTGVIYKCTGCGRVIRLNR